MEKSYQTTVIIRASVGVWEEAIQGKRCPYASSTRPFQCSITYSSCFGCPLTVKQIGIGTVIFMIFLVHVLVLFVNFVSEDDPK